jgi:hypothetical protein
MSYKLLKPYTKQERIDFILEYNRKKGLRIEETELALFALGENEIIVNGKPIIDPNFEEKKELEEKERVARLNMTKLDFATYLQEYGVSYSQLKAELARNDNAQMQWDLCERVYRFNPLLDELAKGFGITPEQLDTMFKKANGEVV